MPPVVSRIKVKVTSQGHTLKLIYQRSSYTKFEVSIFHSSKVIAKVKGSKIKVKVTSQGHTLKIFYQRISYAKFEVSIFHSSKVIAKVKVDDRH